MMIEGVIDRFEGAFALIEVSTNDNAPPMLQIPINLLPPNSQEGDLLTIQISLNATATQQQKQKMQHLADKLWK